MWQPFMIGIGILVLCSAAGVGISFYFAKRREARKDKIKDLLNQFPNRWSSDFLDPKFATRGFLKNSVAFGDMHIDCTPDGLLIHDNGAYHFLYKKENSPLAKIANKAYPLEFIAAYNNYFWIQGDGGKFQLRGALYKGLDFLNIAKDWGWDIYKGVPEGAELPKKYKQS